MKDKTDYFGFYFFMMIISMTVAILTLSLQLLWAGLFFMALSTMFFLLILQNLRGIGG